MIFNLMNRFLLTICLSLVGIASAWAIDISWADVAPRKEAAVTPSTELTLTEVPQDGRPSKSRQASDNWGEWQSGFTGTADSYVAELLSGLCGDQWVEFPERFDILTRENTDNPRLVQYKLVNIFNHVDIILDYDRDTQVLSAQEQDTGIASPFYTEGSDEYYSTYHFILNGVKMFELSKTVYARANKPYFLLIAPNYGYGLDINYFFTFNDLPYYGIGVNDVYQFIPSTQTSKTVDLFIPDGVTRYRVVDYTKEEYDNGVLASSSKKLYLKEPAEDAPAFTTTTSATQTLTPDEVLSYRVLIPLDADGKAAFYPTTLWVYWNKPLAGEWVSAGTVTLKDNLWGFALDHDRTDFPFLDTSAGDMAWDIVFTGEAPAVQQLPIETLSTNPSVYRIKNPYGSTHPYRQYFELPTDADDDFYLVIDATDPSQVVFRPTLAGFNRADDAYGRPFIFDNSNDYFGKMADGKMSFPIEAVKWETGMTYWMQGLLGDVTLDIEFPGHVDYSMTPVCTRLDDQWLVGQLKEISPNVAKIEYALFDYKLYNDELLRFPEKLGKMIADRAEGVKVYTAIPDADHTATLRVPKAEVPYGILSLVAVAVDAQGNHHSSCVVGYYIYNQTPLSMWPKVGNSTVNGWFTQGWSFSDSDNTHAVDLRASPDQEGVYCLYSPFKAEYDYLIENFSGADQTFGYDNTKERHLYVNASNPDQVFISDNPEAIDAMAYYDMNTGVSTDDTGDYSIHQIPGYNGRAYVDSRGFEVIDLSRVIVANMQKINGDFLCGPFIITLDYDPDKDLTRPVNWENVATVTVEENLLSICDGNRDIFTHECRLTRNPANGDIYALIDPLRDAGPVNPDWTFDGEEHHMILNLSDPDKVFFDGDTKWNRSLDFATGYTHSQFGDVYMLYMVNAISGGALVGISDPTPYYGAVVYDETASTLPSVINLDKGICLLSYSTGSVYTGDTNHFRVLLKQSGVDGVTADAAAGDEPSVCWYNLHGVRVATPEHPGVYVRVCAGRTEKVVVK